MDLCYSSSSIQICLSFHTGVKKLFTGVKQIFGHSVLEFLKIILQFIMTFIYRSGSLHIYPLITLHYIAILHCYTYILCNLLGNLI